MGSASTTLSVNVGLATEEARLLLLDLAADGSSSCLTVRRVSGVKVCCSSGDGDRGAVYAGGATSEVSC